MFSGDWLKMWEEDTPVCGEEKNWLPHVTQLLVTVRSAAKNNVAVVPYLSYLLGLAPCDFFLFQELKTRLKGCFDNNEDIH